MPKKKNKMLLKSIVALACAFVILLVIFSMTYEQILKSTIEKIASETLATEVKIGHLSISPLLGSATIIDLRVKNPQGFSDDFIINLPHLSASLETRSLFSEEIVIQEIKAEKMAVLFVVGQKGTNLTQLQSNLKRSTTKTPSKDESSTKQVVIESLRINGSQLRASVMGQDALTVDIKDIHLSNIGKNSDVSLQQAIQIIFESIIENALQASTSISFKSGLDRLLQGTKDIGQGIKNLFRQ